MGNTAFDDQKLDKGVHARLTDVINSRWLKIWTLIAFYCYKTRDYGSCCVQIILDNERTPMQQNERDIAELFGIPVLDFYMRTGISQEQMQREIDDFISQQEVLAFGVNLHRGKGPRA